VQGGSSGTVRLLDGYFTIRLANSAKFLISGLLDGTTWSGLNFAQVSVFADNV
jgi:hypothetical protein